MRVGLIAPPWIPVPPPAYGGIEAMVDLLARGLAKRGDEPVLFTTGDASCPVPRRSVYPRAKGLSTMNPFTEARHVLAAHGALADCDVVHDHTVLGPLLSQRTPTPLVTTVHGPLDADSTPVYEQIAERASIVTISRAQRLQAPHLAVARTIHHGIDVDRVPEGRGGGGYVAFLGRMAPEKGAHRAIRAARAAGVPIRVAAKAWDPEELRYFAERVRPELGEDVEFLGEIGEEDKHELLGDAIALLVPVRWSEPFGMVMIEALACGTPVLAFPEGSAPEIVRHGVNGFLCCDELELGDRIADAATLDRATCRADTRRRFSATQMVEEHAALYRSLLVDRAAATGRRAPLARSG